MVKVKGVDSFFSIIAITSDARRQGATELRSQMTWIKILLFHLLQISSPL